MAFLDTQGSQIYYERHGAGPAMVLAHGIGGNHAAWYQQISALSQSYEVITFDHRGFGRSTDLDQRGRWAFVDDLAALVDHLNLQRFALVGQSMGGGTCVGYAARHAQRVAALVLADTLQGLIESPGVTDIMRQARAATVELGQLERVLSDTTRTQRPLVATLYSQLASFNATDRRSLRGEFSPLLAPGALAQLKIPTLFIAGQHDVLFPPAAIQEMHRQIPGSYYIEVSDAGHSAYFEQPAAFNDSILTFLQAIGFCGRVQPAHSNAPGYVPVSG
jgi:3-oxoadipate enol-lactonase